MDFLWKYMIDMIQKMGTMISENKSYILKLIKTEIISKYLYDWYDTDIFNINISKKFKNN